MINTVLFDMDGLLLDTEPLWGEVMLNVARRHNIPISGDRFKETTGLQIYEVTDYWAVKYPWQGSSPQEVANEILVEIIEAAKERGGVMPGVLDALKLLKSNNYKIGLASSSPMVMIDALIKHYNLEQYFDVVVSADSVEMGKPHPGVFLLAAKKLDASPINCVVLEDSINGFFAGKSARMKVIMVPDVLNYHKPEFMLADARLTSMEEFDLSLLEAL